MAGNDGNLKNEKLERLVRAGKAVGTLLGLAVQTAVDSAKNSDVVREAASAAQDLRVRVSVKAQELSQRASVAAAEVSAQVQDFLKDVRDPNARFAKDVGDKYRQLREQGLSRKEATQALEKYFGETLKQASKKTSKRSASESPKVV